MKQVLSKEEITLIERFYDNELTERELERFQKRLEKNSLFATHVDKFGYANAVVTQLYFPDKGKERSKLKKQLIGEKNGLVFIQKMPKWIKSVAAILLIGVIGGYVLSYQNIFVDPIDYEAIAQQMVKSDAVAGVERGEQEETLLIEAIVNSYEKKQYDTVLEKGMQLDIKSDDNIYFDIQLMKGVAAYHVKKLTIATSMFKEIVASKSGQQDAALWWLVTVYLSEQNKNVAAVKAYLQVIIDNNYATAPQAKRLLRQLE